MLTEPCEILAHDERAVNFCDTGLVLPKITVKATVKAAVKAAVKVTVKRQLRAVGTVLGTPLPYTTTVMCDM